MALHGLCAVIDARLQGLNAGTDSRLLPRLPPLQLFLTPADSMAEEPLKLNMPMDALPPEVLPHMLVVVRAITQVYNNRNQQDWHTTVEMVKAAAGDS